ncbi:hypothetical protein BH09VER1_BH09VER1_04880 [soil metagenome]
MKKALLLPFALGVSALCFFWENHRPSSPEGAISTDAATVLAAALANKETADRFGVSPFSSGNGKIMIEQGKWTWVAMKGYGQSDLQAVVSVAAGKPTVLITQNTLDAWE